ncbi:MAG TPA: large-conductance mechanosensitive channel protein MscL [Steroidobacteraceae bacterium]|nr:large-conductance mechanosensitive channel protein MscL [Steroidobacteraceae bacterium]
MSIAKEFREFAVKGNVVDMAVGIIIGAAFGKIVSSLVSDVVTPPLGYIIGGVDFTKLAVTLPAMREGAEAVTIRYGVFLQALFDFIIVAFAIFMIVKLINRLRRKEEEKPPAAPPAPPRQEVLLEEIRDLLKNR